LHIPHPLPPNHLLKDLTDTIIMSAEKKMTTKKMQMICPGCLMVFTVSNRESEKMAPKCHYCNLPLEEVKYSR
jgi:hypothetical protein